jgi:cytochrome oxidase Cu insertion factor (SCO1/SenC/PrrC family)
MTRVAVLALVAVLAAACGGTDDEPQTAGSTSATHEGVTLEGETLDGEQLALADLRGSPVFVNVWASW